MASKSLPAYLQQALEDHVSRSELENDAEMQFIFERLGKLNESVEKIKSTIREKQRLQK